MAYAYFSHNGRILPTTDAAVPLENIEYSYGFGVYETIRYSNGAWQFLEDHLERLSNSAGILALEHGFSKNFIQTALEELVSKNQVETCNIKILLIGGVSSEKANLYVLCLNPLFPDRKLYQNGVKCTTYYYERIFPGAKTLNMLPSYLAYRKAKQAGAYDALLINKTDYVTEGTRTNFFVMRGHTLYTPPEAEVLNGVIRQRVISVAIQNNYEIKEMSIGLDSLKEYDSAFLTNTSTKIMPVASVNEYNFGGVSEELKKLMKIFNEYLTTQTGGQA